MWGKIPFKLGNFHIFVDFVVLSVWLRQIENSKWNVKLNLIQKSTNQLNFSQKRGLKLLSLISTNMFWNSKIRYLKISKFDS